MSIYLCDIFKFIFVFMDNWIFTSVFFHRDATFSRKLRNFTAIEHLWRNQKLTTNIAISSFNRILSWVILTFNNRSRNRVILRGQKAA